MNATAMVLILIFIAAVAAFNRLDFGRFD